MKLSDKKKLGSSILTNVGSGMNIEDATKAANEWLRRNGFRRMNLSVDDTKRILQDARNCG